MKKALIITGGIPPKKKLIEQEIKTHKIIIAVDGGANCLTKYNIIPQYLIGDLDSIKQKALNFCIKKNVKIESYSIHKNFTDTELSIQKIRRLKIKSVTLLACLEGKRIDHLIAAIGILYQCYKYNIKATLKDENQIITLLTKSAKIYGNPGDIFSLQVYGSKSTKNLSIINGKYQVKNYYLKLGEAKTISNKFKSKTVTINFSSGMLLLIINKNYSN